MSRDELNEVVTRIQGEGELRIADALNVVRVDTGAQMVWSIGLVLTGDRRESRLKTFVPMHPSTSTWRVKVGHCGNGEAGYSSTAADVDSRTARLFSLEVLRTGLWGKLWQLKHDSHHDPY